MHIGLGVKDFKEEKSWGMIPQTLGMSTPRAAYPVCAPCGAAIKSPDAAMGVQRIDGT